MRINYGFTATGGTTGASIETTALQKTPFSVIRSGGYSWVSGGLSDRGGGGYYWSSHAYSSADIHNLYFGASNFGPQAGGVKPPGFTVRCVVR